MAVLHVVSRSPWVSPSLQQCLHRARKGDAVLLSSDGVYAALGGSESARMLGAVLADGIDVYCLLPDLEKRGIVPSQLGEGLETVDYDGFVDLAVRLPRSCSW
ncbi:MAG: sulfur relay protein TusB/DsrH [Proteobacteria bacterium]|nr:sulfur relay protein TusB/DsrH [Pseudomonadota bacterium]